MSSLIERVANGPICMFICVNFMIDGTAGKYYGALERFPLIQQIKDRQPRNLFGK